LGKRPEGGSQKPLLGDDCQTPVACGVNRRKKKNQAQKNKKTSQEMGPLTTANLKNWRGKAPDYPSSKHKTNSSLIEDGKEGLTERAAGGKKRPEKSVSIERERGGRRFQASRGGKFCYRLCHNFVKPA